MSREKFNSKILVFCCALFMFLVMDITVEAKTTTLEDGTVFDSDYYANTYPDLKAAFGYDYNALLNHYLNLGNCETH